MNCLAERSPVHWKALLCGVGDPVMKYFMFVALNRVRVVWADPSQAAPLFSLIARDPSTPVVVREVAAADGDEHAEARRVGCAERGLFWRAKNRVSSIHLVKREAGAHDASSQTLIHVVAGAKLIGEKCSKRAGQGSAAAREARSTS